METHMGNLYHLNSANTDTACSPIRSPTQPVRSSRLTYAEHNGKVPGHRSGPRRELGTAAPPLGVRSNTPLSLVPSYSPYTTSDGPARLILGCLIKYDSCLIKWPRAGVFAPRSLPA